MRDKEVGELWQRKVKEHGFVPGFKNYEFELDESVELIWKLVEDRQTLWWHQLGKRPGGTNPQEALRYALRDFGIDPATWEQKHEG
jgi:hypothetical protein